MSQASARTQSWCQKEKKEVGKEGIGGGECLVTVTTGQCWGPIGASWTENTAWAEAKRCATVQARRGLASVAGRQGSGELSVQEEPSRLVPDS